MPTLPGTSAEGVQHGGYVVYDTPGGHPDVILLGTGSELTLAYEAAQKLEADGIKSRVVSMVRHRYAHRMLVYTSACTPVHAPVY